jgi:hypothetical protein
MLGKPKPKKKLDTVAKLKKKADIAFSKFIRHRDGRWSHEVGWETLCITCGKWLPLKQMQAGHFVSRAVNALRYHPHNVNGQCYGCNVAKNGDQYNHGLQIDVKYGEGTAAKLFARRHETHKFTPEELKIIIEDAKQKTHELRLDKPDVAPPVDPDADPALDMFEGIEQEELDEAID